MSTKTIAVDTRVYGRLAKAKQESESFSKAIDRMLSRVQSEHTGNQILHGLADLASLSEADAKEMRNRVDNSRSKETWKPNDLS